MVLTGTGVYGAACAGVLLELWQRQMEPYAVCGLGTGAWPAALYAAGCDAQGVVQAASQAQRMGRKMLTPNRGFVRGKAQAAYASRGMQRLLNAHTGGRILALCPRKAIFPLKTARTGHGLVFSSHSYSPGEGAILTMQASAAFAAHAAMSLPPYLEPAEWMGSALLPVRDTRFAVKQLFTLGAQRVLVVDARPSPQRAMDALEMAAMCAGGWQDAGPAPAAAYLRVVMPESIGAWSFGEIAACMEQGKKTAERELDQILSNMGMASCKVLPFHK